MSDELAPPGLTFSELRETDLQRERQALIDLTREAAAARLAPGFPKVGLPHQHLGDSETTMAAPAYRWCLYTIPAEGP